MMLKERLKDLIILLISIVLIIFLAVFCGSKTSEYYVENNIPQDRELEKLKEINIFRGETK